MHRFEKCEIVEYPAKVLCNAAERIEKIDDNIRILVDKMTKIMLKNEGIGLAAPQVGVPLRLFIISLDSSIENTRIYINPTLNITTEEIEDGDESCLSIPGLSAKIKRYKKCRFTATDLAGNEFTKEAKDIYARCLQHEYDHIEGKTLIDHITEAEKTAYLRKLKDS